MKKEKPKYPYVFQTVSFELTEEQQELFDLETKEFKSALDNGNKNYRFITRMNAIHAGVTKNFHFFPAEELDKSVERWTKPYSKPILKNHDLELDPVGRVIDAQYLKFSESDGVMALTAEIKDPDAADKIRDGRLVTVSVGVWPKTHTCTVCGRDFFDDECEHWPGATYQTEDGDDIVAAVRLGDLDWIECSFVNLPADQNGDRAAGVISYSEKFDENFDFYTVDGEDSKPRRKKKGDATSPDIALAVKESWEELLRESFSKENMKENNESQSAAPEETLEATEEELENTDAEITSEEVEEAEVETSEEETSSEAPETEESPSEVDLLTEFFSVEDTDEKSEETTEEVSEVPDEEVQESIQELENENASLKMLVAELEARIAAEEESAAEMAKHVRKLVLQSVIDLKLALDQIDTTGVEAEEATLSEQTLKGLLEDLKNLRKELKEARATLQTKLSADGVIDNESLGSPDAEFISDSPVEDKQEVRVTVNEAQTIEVLTRLLSSKKKKERF